MVRILYLRCDCGSPRGPRHYYTGETCPISGWVAPFVRESLTAAAEVVKVGKPLSVAALREAGLSRKAIARVLIAEFPSVSAVPESLSLAVAEPGRTPDRGGGK